jgi:deoxyribonuclease-4
MDAASEAIRLGIPIFQCFLTNQLHHKLIKVDTRTVTSLQELHPSLRTIYIHGSYWINLAGLQERGNRALFKEISLAKRLGCSHLILHPGSAVGIHNHTDRINALAQILNSITTDEPEMNFILENTCHGNSSVGSNLEDFYHLKQKLERPKQITFCIDTAHAHAYGYDLVDPEKQNGFIELIDQTIGLENVKLIHLNDAAHEQGSRIDKHAAIGNGCIGEDALKTFALDPRLSSIPLILELPILPDGEEDAMLQKVQGWHL